MNTKTPAERYAARKVWFDRAQLHVFEGDLCKITKFPSSRVVRERYECHLARIANTLELRASLRAGIYTSVGGYATAFVTSDGALLCHACVRAEQRQVSEAIRHKLGDGWRVVALTCECDSDESAQCEHCNNEIWTKG
jgi:hypothetical protein